MNIPYSTDGNSYREWIKKQLESGKFNDIKLTDNAESIDDLIETLMKSGFKPDVPVLDMGCYLT